MACRHLVFTLNGAGGICSECGQAFSFAELAKISQKTEEAAEPPPGMVFKYGPYGRTTERA